MPLEIYKRGAIWHYRGTVNGRRLRGSTKTADRKVAERFKAEVEKRAWQRYFDGPTAGLTMTQVFTAYLDADKSDRFLVKLSNYWKDTLVEDIHAETVRRAATVDLLEQVRERQPGLVEELIPNVMTVSDVQRVLQNLLQERVSIGNIDLI